MEDEKDGTSTRQTVAGRVVLFLFFSPYQSGGSGGLGVGGGVGGGVISPSWDAGRRWMLTVRRSGSSLFR